MAKTKERYVKVKGKTKWGVDVTKWKDTQTGEIHDYIPLGANLPRKGGELGISELPEDVKTSVRGKQEEWRESLTPESSGGDGIVGGVLPDYDLLNQSIERQKAYEASLTADSETPVESTSEVEGPTPIPSADPSFQGGTQIPPMNDTEVTMLEEEVEKNNKIKQFADKQNASSGWSNQNLVTLNYNNPEGFGYTRYSSLLENNNFNPYSSILQDEDTPADIPDTSLEPKIEAPAPEPEVGTDAHRDNWLKQTSRSPAARAFEEDDPRRADWDRMRYEQMLDHKGLRPAPKSEVSTGDNIDASIAKDLVDKNKG